MIGRRRIISVALVLVTLGLLIFLSSSPFIQPWRARALEVVVPFLGGSERLSGILWSLIGGSARIAELERERAEFLSRFAESEEFRRENEVLREALSLAREGEAGALPAHVIAAFREGRDEYLLLDRGSRDGLGVGDLVLGSNRVLAGTVAEVSERTAKAILVTSASRSTEVRLAGGELRAIARGANSRELVVELVPQDAELHAGDLLVASSRATGQGRMFLVAEVREVRQAENEVFKTVRAIHLFDPASETVLVLVAP